MAVNNKLQVKPKSETFSNFIIFVYTFYTNILPSSSVTEHVLIKINTDTQKITYPQDASLLYAFSA